MFWICDETCIKWSIKLLNFFSKLSMYFTDQVTSSISSKSNSLSWSSYGIWFILCSIYSIESPSKFENSSVFEVTLFILLIAFWRFLKVLVLTPCKSSDSKYFYSLYWYWPMVYPISYWIWSPFNSYKMFKSRLSCSLFS